MKAQRLRETIAGGGGSSLAARARARRWELLLARFPDLARYRVVDLGGTAQFWAGAPVRPAHVTVVNLELPLDQGPDWVESVVGDACDPTTIGDRNAFDLTFSNSTIEHVGGHHRCLAFAHSVRTLAPRHWIQTPYRYFPIEPHFLFPGFQFLPMAARTRIITHWPLSYTRSIGGHLDDPAGTVTGTELLGRAQLRYYFPESEIVAETIAGLPKSIIAVRH